MEELSKRARAVAAVVEPVAAQVYFSPECHQGYGRLGFGPSPGDFSGVAAPDMAAYFTSRGSVMGQVPGQVVAAAFGVFNPSVVVPAVERGWSLTDAGTICSVRDEGPSPNWSASSVGAPRASNVPTSCWLSPSSG